MRRKDREIFDEEIEDILKKGKDEILSTVGYDGKMYMRSLSLITGRMVCFICTAL